MSQRTLIKDIWCDYKVVIETLTILLLFNAIAFGLNSKHVFEIILSRTVSNSQSRVTKIANLNNADIIIPKPGKAGLQLDSSGRDSVKLSDLATISAPPGDTVFTSVNPQFVYCSDIGTKDITITAQPKRYTPDSVGLGIPDFLLSDAAGNLIFTDNNSGALQQITADGKASVLASDLKGPNGLAKDAQGNIYVVESGSGEIKKLSPSGVLSKIITNRPLVNPYGLAIDASGNLYVTSSTAGTIAKITPAGIVTIVASGFGMLAGIAVDAANNLYVADKDNFKIYEIAADGTKKVLAGSTYGYKDGAGVAAKFQGPAGLTLDAKGNLYVTDEGSHTIRKIDATGVVTTVAGNGVSGLINGAANKAEFDAPRAVAIDSKSNIYIADDGYNNLIRKISPSGNVTTYAGKSGTFMIKSGNIYTADGTADVMVIPVTVKGFLKITTVFKDTTVYNNGSCPAAMPDYTAKAKARSYCGKKIIFSQVPLPGAVLGGSQTAVVTATDEFGTADSVKFTVSSNSSNAAQANVAIAASDSIFCRGAPSSFSATATNAGGSPKYQWQINGADTAGNVAVLTRKSSKDGDIINCKLSYVIANCSAPQTVISNFIKVSVLDLLVPKITINVDRKTICKGTLVTFSAMVENSGSNPSYRWAINGVPVTSAGKSFATSDLKDGDKVTCTLISSAKCLVNNSVTSDPIMISVRPLTTNSIKISPGIVNGCAGDMINFAATPGILSATLHYNWLINGLSVGIYTPTFNTSTLSDGDKVQCILSDTSACLLPVSSNISQVNLAVRPAMIFPKNYLITKGDSVVLNPEISGVISKYSWSPAYGLKNTLSKTPVAMPEVTTTYTLTVVANNGCEATGTVTVTVIPQFTLPNNTFTPNGDGINDTWKIPSLTFYPQAIVKIFNRTGILIFYSAGYLKDWDGEYNGKPLPAGTYFYIIQTDPKSKPFAGSVSILR